MIKIFGIGLPKSGTTSLHRAAQILGLRSIHFPDDGVTLAQVRRGDYRLEVMARCDIISDVPIPAIFPQIDHAFRGAKFILTRRPLGPWLASHEKARFNQDRPKPGSLRDFYLALLYGVTDFNAERFTWVYENHHAKVRRYFAGERAGDLLTIDVTAGEGWARLCALSRPAGAGPALPHENRAAADEPAGWWRKLTRRRRWVNHPS
jgi:hypothetical protein